MTLQTHSAFIGKTLQRIYRHNITDRVFTDHREFIDRKLQAHHLETKYHIHIQHLHREHFYRPQSIYKQNIFTGTEHL